MKLYLCRHGETAWSLSGQHTGKTDLSLTEKGKVQAAGLRKEIQGVSFEKIFSSPKKRALESAEGLHPVLDPHLVEWDYGDYESLTSDEIRKKNPGWNLFMDGAPGGETVEQVKKRADQFLKRLNGYKGNVALFSHGHFLRALTARFLGLEMEMGQHFLLSTASLSILGYEKDQPVIVLWNQIA